MRSPRHAAAALCFILILMTGAALARPVVVLLTDFGLTNEAAGLCHGAILQVDPEIQIIDLTHNVKPFDVRQGAQILGRVAHFPPGTVFVAVVDPGVGTDRTSVALKSKRGFYFVAPNNGLLTEVVRAQGVESAVLLDPKRINPEWQPGTFDGRDLYSPAGALLAHSGGDLASLGRPARLEDIVLLGPDAARVEPGARRISGRYTRTDEPYGNVWTNITEDNLKQIHLALGERLTVNLAGHEAAVPFVKTFGDVPEGQPLAYLNSDGHLALALNMGDLRRVWGLGEGAEVVLTAPPPAPGASNKK